ncbi:MAG: MMPL family transporter, partial [Planctomycetota bacterium]
MTIGTPIVRFRWWVLAGWIAGGCALALLVGGIDPSANEPESLLPPDTPYSLAVAAMERCFPDNSHLSEAAVVFERCDGKLTDADFAAIESVAERIARPDNAAGESDLVDVKVRSPRSIRLKVNPLISDVSDKGQAALIVVSVPVNFITHRSARIVENIRRILSSWKLPEGLKSAVTGSSGFGHDYADAAKRSHRQTLRVTIAAVIVILLVVYRAPIAALVPLVAISAAAFVALKILAAAQQFGMHVGMAERIFVVVLLYGAGTDYSLFFISRFREFLSDGFESRAATAQALDATFPAILASAGTDTAGLLMLCFADYRVFRTTGPAVAVALMVALLAAVTLVPCAVAIIGGRLFYPNHLAATGRGKGVGFGGRRSWPALARMVTARPA